MNWWFIAFQDEKRALGYTVVHADDAEAAWNKTHELGVNPGGQVFIYCIVDPTNDPYASQLINKLIPPDQYNEILEASGHPNGKMSPEETKEFAKQHAEFVCETHNKKH